MDLVPPSLPEHPMRLPLIPILLAAGMTLACSPGRAADSSRAAGGDTTATTTTSAGAALAADTAELGRLAAQVARNGLRIRKGDVVMIAGGKHTIPAMEAFALETARLGGVHSLLLHSERVLRAELTEIPEEHLGLPADHFADWLRSTTVYIGLPGQADPKAVFADVPEPRLAKWSAGFSAIYDMLNNSRVRGAYIDYPSPGAAAAVGMDPDAFTRMQLAAIGADPEGMMRTGQALEEKFRNARSVRITSPAGTDLRLILAGRPGIVDAGMLSPGAEREKLFAKRWFVLPGGNFGIAPRETSATGTLVIPRDMCKFGPVRDARYEFSEGSVTSVTAAEGEPCVSQQLEAYGANLKRIGSIGVGLNPELRVVEQGGDYRPYNAAGMVGIFLGDNTLMGGTNKVPGAVGIGLPVVNATVEVDGQVLVRDGKLAAGEVASSGVQ
jgi:aminopeptidase